MGGYLADLDKQYRSDYDPGRRSEIGARAAEQPSAAYAQRRIGVGNPQSRHQAVPVWALQSKARTAPWKGGAPAQAAAGASARSSTRGMKGKHNQPWSDHQANGGKAAFITPL